MRKFKLVLVIALVAVVVFALAGCGKQGAAKAKYEGEVTESVIMDKLIVKYPVAFKINEKRSSESTLRLSKDNEDWEVAVGLVVYGSDITPYKDFAGVEKDNKAVYDKVEKITVMGKEALKIDAGAAIRILIPAHDTFFVEFSCNVQLNKGDADYKTAFDTPEVQYILENLTVK